MFDRARLQPGETLLVQGGTSGIGVTAIQLAKAAARPVIVTAGSDEKCAACVALGADHAINYRTQTSPPRCASPGKGADVILDMVAGDYVARELNCLAEDGRIVIIAVQGGVQSGFDAGLVRAPSPDDHRLDAAAAAGGLQRVIGRALREHVWPWIEAGRVAGDPRVFGAGRGRRRRPTR